MSEKSNSLSGDVRYLLSWDTTATVGTKAGERRTRVRGETILVVHGDHATRRGVSMERFAIAGASVSAHAGVTGVFTVIVWLA